jgi:hypothetical protein
MENLHLKKKKKVEGKIFGKRKGPEEGEREGKRVMWSEYDQSIFIHTYENVIMKPIILYSIH